MGLLSANTLFHFTNKKALLSILETGFRPSYRKENGITDGLSSQTMHIPMVCFCDIPLSMLDRHLNGYKWTHENIEHSYSGYGRFGLGMSKSWAIKNALNPVAYTIDKSTFHAGLHESNNILAKVGLEFYEYYHSLLNKSNSSGPEQYHQRKIQSFVDRFRKALSFTTLSVAFIKPYTSASTGQRFYDEKEWRFVPIYQEKNEFGTFDIKVPTSHELAPLHEQFIAHMKEMISINQQLMLSFNAEDVKYIIVENDGDIKDIIDCLKLLPERYSEEQRERLITRIITCEQIQNDF